MPHPVAVVRDADGKVVGQIAGADWRESGPVVFLNVGGKFSVFVLFPWGLEGRMRTVFFDSPGCIGTPYVKFSGNWDSGVWKFSERLATWGPDPVAGSYRVYRRASQPVYSQNIYSLWEGGECVAASGDLRDNLMLAEEVIPNPLGGFHGPTLAEPDRVWTIDGGDRIVQSSTPAPTPPP
jgi:hypothetical protein